MALLRTLKCFMLRKIRENLLFIPLMIYIYYKNLVDDNPTFKIFTSIRCINIYIYEIKLSGQVK